MSLPTYQQAIERPSILWLASPAMDNNTLAACCRLSKQVNLVFRHLIWSDPVRIIVTKAKPYFAMQKFVDKARDVRKEVRNLVAILDLRRLLCSDVTSAYPRDFQVYEQNIEEEWYRTPLALFPRIRIIIIDEALTIYRLHPQSEANQESMSTLYSTEDPSNPPPIQDRYTTNDHFPLVISAENCWNLDSASLIQSTSNFLSNIMYLDLSGTTTSVAWQQTLSRISLPNLRVLKLRRLRFTDTNIHSILLNSANNLWSLDVSENLLSDTIVEKMLSLGIAHPIIHPFTSSGIEDEEVYEQTPSYERHEFGSTYQPSSSISTFRNDSLYGVINQLRSHCNSPCEDFEAIDANNLLLKKTGLTHLYLSSTNITSTGVKELLKSTNRLQLLDVGMIKPTRRTGSATINLTNFASMLHRSTGTRLESLRIHHSIITQIPTALSWDDALTFKLSHLYSAETYASSASSAAHPPPFSPRDNNNLSALTLTCIPTVSYGAIIARLRKFIRACIAQEQLLRAAHGSRNRRAPKVLRGLRTLTLEFMEPGREGGWWAAAGPSVSGDKDADDFLQSSAGDFSFFAGESESTLSSTEPQQRTSGIEPRHSETATRSHGLVAKDVLLNVTDELKSFRKAEGKAWTGTLKLVIPHRAGVEK